MAETDAAKLARRIAKLEDTVAALARGRQVAYSTVEVEVPDEEGAPVEVSLPMPVAIQRGVQALATTADLQEQIDGIGTGTQITSSPAAPTAEDTAPEGSLWFQVDEANSIIGQWQMIGGAWEAQKVRSEVIANLDVAKLTGDEIAAELIGVETLRGKTIVGGTVIGGTIEGEVEVSSGGGIVARSTSGQVARFATVDENGDLRMDMQESGVVFYPSGGGLFPDSGDQAWIYGNRDGSGKMSLLLAAANGTTVGDGDDGQINVGYRVDGVTYDLRAQKAIIGAARFTGGETVLNGPMQVAAAAGAAAIFNAIQSSEGGGWEVGTALRVPNLIPVQVRSAKYLTATGAKALARGLYELVNLTGPTTAVDTATWSILPIPSGTGVEIVDTLNDGTAAGLDPSGSHVVLPITGRYVVVATTRFGGSSAGTARSLAFQVGEGARQFEMALRAKSGEFSTAPIPLQSTGIIRANAGSHIRVYVRHDAGGSNNVRLESLSVSYLGPL